MPRFGTTFRATILPGSRPVLSHPEYSDRPFSRPLVRLQIEREQILHKLPQGRVLPPEKCHEHVGQLPIGPGRTVLPFFAESATSVLVKTHIQLHVAINGLVEYDLAVRPCLAVTGQSVGSESLRVCKDTFAATMVSTIRMFILVVIEFL